MRSVLLAAVALSALGFPALLPAQSSPVQITLIPRVGVLTQAAPFDMNTDHFSVRPRPVFRYRFEDDLVLGLAAEVEWAGVPVRLRGEVSHAPSLTLVEDEESTGPDVWGDDHATMTSTTVSVVVQPRQTCVGAVCPRVLAGVGVKHYRLSAELLSGDIVSPLAQDQTQTTLQLGAGVEARLSRLSLIAEVNDYSNDFDFYYQIDNDGRVHDVVATLGLAVRVQ